MYRIPHSVRHGWLPTTQLPLAGPGSVDQTIPSHCERRALYVSGIVSSVALLIRLKGVKNLNVGSAWQQGPRINGIPDAGIGFAAAGKQHGTSVKQTMQGRRCKVDGVPEQSR